ncbi:hypothetical protein K2173_004423 [Erythroxylum novogranatense]|uniref:(+)-delta-cadinene synthase n=1 Tax=Erythroxylum novogranatense TaxID=1862640 RepID=A0AAV8T4G1_9ROSI|nr:hypothetical protein K2173_004423 [Erythroxylum novogranatense]
MSMASKNLFTVCPAKCAQKPTPEIAKPNFIDFKRIPGAKSWNIADNNAVCASSSKRLSPLTQLYLTSDGSCVELEQKLKACKHIFSQLVDDSLDSLVLVDAIQRLGIDHHFQEEIEAILESHHKLFSSHVDNNLHEAALRFRLLRQQGYHVSAGVFNNFKDEEGKFHQNLSADIQGLMGLYEASQLSVGEDILDEANGYSYQLLTSLATHADPFEARLVRHTIEHPHHKSLTRFMARHFFSHLKGSNGCINALQDLASFDFHIVQHQHQREIVQISRWWKEVGLSEELEFARDQPVKWYMWSVASLSNPKLSEQRIDITKVISFIYIIDDIFDVYGTLNELISFTEVVDRWDIAAVEVLPDYMKTCFRALDNLTNEISYKIHKDHRWNPVRSLRRTWASLCKAFLAEARWFASGHLPTSEDYLKNGIVSSGVHVVLVHIFFLLGQDLTKDNVELVESNPTIISSTATILRLWDDLGSAKDENQCGQDGSFVECYMNEKKSSLDDARKRVLRMIAEAWKTLNRECLYPTSFSPTFRNASLNMARMVPLMYSYDDQHRLPSLEESIESLLYENGSPWSKVNP